VKEVLAAITRVTGTAVPYTAAPRRPGDPGILYASSARIRMELGWRPRFEDIDTIVDTAWRWRRSHPRGYGEAAGR
jgi:UDP-glucose 4-epimerase